MRLAAGKFHKLCPIVAVLLILLNSCGGTDDRVLEEDVEHVYKIDSSASISIQNRGGAVLVYGSNTNEMRVQAVKKAYSHERLNQIAIGVSTKPNAVSVTTTLPPQPKWALFDRSGTVDYTITVPATASISTLDLNAGEIFLESMRGPEVRARLNDGRIFARNCFTNLHLIMNRGALTLAYDWWEQEKFSAQVNLGQGNAWVFLPTDAACHLLAHAVRGKISNDFNNVLVSANPSAKGMTIDQVVNGRGQATIEIKVTRGNIKVAEANP